MYDKMFLISLLIFNILTFSSVDKVSSFVLQSECTYIEFASFFLSKCLFRDFRVNLGCSQQYRSYMEFSSLAAPEVTSSAASEEKCIDMIVYPVSVMDWLILLFFLFVCILINTSFRHWASIHKADGLLIARSREVSSREIWVQSFPIVLKFDRHIDNSAAEMPVKFQNE